jgi:hypothetical protein
MLNLFGGIGGRLLPRRTGELALEVAPSGWCGSGVLRRSRGPAASSLFLCPVCDVEVTPAEKLKLAKLERASR